MEEGRSDRFNYLLQPLRDLADFWNVDIAKPLETYEKELRELAEQEDFDVEHGHRLNLNDASALIQGTAHIYGKKVDYVYNETVELSASLKDTTKTKKKATAGVDPDENEGGEDADNVGTANAALLRNPMQLVVYKSFKAQPVESLALKRSANRPLLPQISMMPMSLMPLASYEKSNVSLIARTRKAEVIGKKDDFKMNTGYLHKTGALLLDPINKDLVDNFASFAKFATWRTADVTDEALTEQHENGTERDVEQSSGPIGDIIDDPEVNGSDRSHPGMDYGSQPTRVSSRMELLRHRPSSALDDRRETIALRPSSRFNSDQFGDNDQVSFVDFDGGDGGNSDGGGYFEAANLTKVEERNPWDLTQEEMDEIDEDLEEAEAAALQDVKWKRIPFKKVNNVVNIKKLTEKKKKEEEAMDKRARTLQCREYFDEFFYRVPRPKAGGSADWTKSALAPFVAAAAKRRAEKRKLLEKEKKAREEDEENAPPEEPSDLFGDDFFGYDDDCDDFDALAIAQRDQEADAQQDFSPHEPIGDDAFEVVVPAQSLYANRACAGGSQDTLGNGCLSSQGSSKSASSSQPIPFNPNANEWIVPRPPPHLSLEEIVKFYVERFWTAMEEYKHDLDKEVEKWETELIPILEEEERTKDFDVHEYGDYLLGQFDNVGEEKTMSELLEGKEQREVSRYLLSVLLMANTNNVEIDYDEEKGGDVQVKLLKRERHHEVFDQDGAM